METGKKQYVIQRVTLIFRNAQRISYPVQEEVAVDNLEVERQRIKEECSELMSGILKVQLSYYEYGV